MPSPLRASVWLALLAPLLAAAACDPEAGAGPHLQVQVNGADSHPEAPLVVPPGGFTLHVAATGASPDALDPASLGASLHRWGGETLDVGASLLPHARGAVLVMPEDAGLAEGSWTFRAWGIDRHGRLASDEVVFAVRRFRGPPPIGSGQTLWIDLASDRDATPGADFEQDLRAFGLASPGAPELAATAREEIALRVLERLGEVYHEVDALGLGLADPVAVDFALEDPGHDQVTRICVGGADPSGLHAIGNVRFDPGNRERAGEECGRSPATGVFPREMLGYRSEPAFRAVFDGLRPETGGVPLGDHPLDALVLAPDFEPEAAGTLALARFEALDTAFQAFADALGTVVAHEAAHALGLVAPGPPGGGLHGGSRGAAFAHRLGPGLPESARGEPSLMRPGARFDFAQLAGLEGEPLPRFGALEFAYLRDRIVLDPRVERLRPPPVVRAASPSRIRGRAPVALRVAGSGFAPEARLRLRGPTGAYPLARAQRGAPRELRAWARPERLAPGRYDLEVENPDGQRAVLAGAIRVEG